MWNNRQTCRIKSILYFAFILIVGFQTIVVLGSTIKTHNGEGIEMVQITAPSNELGITVDSEAALVPKASFQTSLTPIFVGYTYWHANDGYSKHSGMDMRAGYDYDFWNEAWRGYTEYDLSSIPDNSTILSISIQFEVTGSIPECDTQNAELQIFNMSIRPSTGDKVLLYEDAGDGQKFYSTSIVMNDNYYPDTASFYPLNNEAKTAFQQALKQDWFAIGFMDEESPETDEGIIFHISQLKVEYITFVDDIYDIAPNNNDIIANASLIQVGTIENLRCFDTDFYKIAVSQEAQLHVNVSFYHPDGNLNLSLYGPTFQMINSSTDDKSDASIEITHCIKSQNTGWYYLGISKLESKNNSYTLTLNIENCTQIWSPINPNGNPDNFFLSAFPYIVIVIFMCVIINIVLNKHSKIRKKRETVVPITPSTALTESALDPASSPPRSHAESADTHFVEKEKDEKEGSMTTCRYCGSTIRQNATFCHYCGTKFE